MMCYLPLSREFWFCDKLVTRMLRKAGWQVVRLWEHELRDTSQCLRRLGWPTRFSS